MKLLEFVESIVGVCSVGDTLIINKAALKPFFTVIETQDKTVSYLTYTELFERYTNEQEVELLDLK